VTHNNDLEYVLVKAIETYRVTTKYSYKCDFLQEQFLNFDVLAVFLMKV